MTADEPPIVAALRWWQTYARRYDVRRVAAFQQAFVGASNDPFYLGKVAMTPMHVSALPYERRYAPDVEYDVAPLPAPAGGEYPSGWMGGWSVALPRGTRGSAAAFEFCRWMTATPAGTLAVGTGTGNFPAYRASPYYDVVRRDPDLAVFLDIAQHSRHARATMPAQGYLMLLIRRACDQALCADRDAKAALADVSRDAQRRLDEVVHDMRSD